MPVLTLTKLVSAEYLIRSVADGMEDYFMGAGEAPGVWQGRWAAELGLEGVVGADQLRRLVEGQHPTSGEELLAGRPARKVNAFDVTLSCPKSVSLLWAFGSDETASVVSIAQSEATSRALVFLEERAALARQQSRGVRRRVATGGFAVATFVHRTSRDGDPQLHTHCLVPNVIRRADGTHVAFDANLLHEWAKPVGTIFQNELQRLLTERLGVEWGAARNGTRELIGFSRDQLRRFSKRTVAIEARLEAAGEEYVTAAERMRADDRASLATRVRKDVTLTPERLRGRWEREAAEVGIEPGGVERLVCGRVGLAAEPGREALFAALVDPESGVCARESTFGEADVVAHLAAGSAGRLTTGRISELAGEFLASEHVVRLTPASEGGRRRPPAWSTVEHRRLEDRVLLGLRVLLDTSVEAIPNLVVDVALGAHPGLGGDQAAAVRALCGPGPALRAVLAPAGHGKTSAVRAAAEASETAGRGVIALATTNKAVAELAAAGVPAMTIARFGLDVGTGTVPAGTTVIVDEVSQVSTRDAAVVLDAVVGVPGVQLWVLGDPGQAQAVRAAGLAAEIDRLAAERSVPAASLTVNRRQVDADERDALARYRAGDLAASQAIRAERGWEHEHDTPDDTRDALAAAAVAAADEHGPAGVAVLAVSHADCEDLADRIRAARQQRGELTGPVTAGPAWGPAPRCYAAGDRVLLHDNLHIGGRRLHNGSTGTITQVESGGLQVWFDDSDTATLPNWFVQGSRPDGDPNVSHGWARTVEGAQGGTWAQVHLLGTAALDRFKGYVGQSRGQQPTHTWNVTRAGSDDDHGGLAPDDRTAGEQVLQAMGRAPRKTFAAEQDPWTLDASLNGERAQHEAVIAARPPGCARDVADAVQALERARHEHAGARAFHKGAGERLAAIGPLAGLRRAGRAAKAHAEAELAKASGRLDQANERLGEAATAVETAHAQQAARDRWDGENGWRVERVAAIDDELRHHWAHVVLAAAREDDPLAFGVERLRAARASFLADVQALDGSLPPDRSSQLRRAEADLHRRQEELRAIEAHQPDAHKRLFGRRHPAEPNVRIRRAQEAVDAAATAVQHERDAMRARSATVSTIEPARREALAALELLSPAVRMFEPQPSVPAVAEPRHARRDPGIDLGIDLGF